MTHAGVHGWPVLAAATGTGGLVALAWVALKVGALSYGGGFVIIPLMQGDAVDTHHWMTGAQFANAVAYGQLTPGPVTHTVAIVGWAAAGPLAGKSYAEVSAAPETEEMVAGYVKELNARLNRWETIKKFTLLPRDLSIEDGELTPSMKVKRRIVEQSFAGDIDKMYEGSVAQL